MLKTIACLSALPNKQSGCEWNFTRLEDGTGLKWPIKEYDKRREVLKTATRQHELAQFDLAPKVLEVGLIKIGSADSTIHGVLGYRTEAAEVTGVSALREYFNCHALHKLKEKACFQEFFKGLKSVETKYSTCSNDLHWNNLGLIRRNGSLRLVLIDCGDNSSS